MSEIDKFFDDLPSQDKREANIFDDKITEKAPAEGDKTPGEGEDTNTRKNRRERRREERDQRKDDMIIALNDRIIELSKSTGTDTKQTRSSEVPPEWIALYGDTPEARKAWDVNNILLNRAKEDAKTEALEQFRGEQNAVIEETKKFERFIDSELEALEDEHDVDLTSDAPAARKARRELLEMVESLSPKDESGTIIGYADFDKTFEIYQNNRKNDKSSEIVDRKKELSDRSMTKGSSSQNIDVQEGPITFDTARKAISRMLNS